MENKAKFGINQVLTIGLTLVVAGIGIAYGLEVLADVKEDFYPNTAGCNATSKSACSFEYNASQDSITAVAKLPEKFPTIATVIIAAVVIGILVTYLSFR